MTRGCTVIAAEAAIQESPGVARPATAIPTVMFEPAEARQSSILDTGLRRYDENPQRHFRESGSLRPPAPGSVRSP